LIANIRGINLWRESESEYERVMRTDGWREKEEERKREETLIMLATSTKSAPIFLTPSGSDNNSVNRFNSVTLTPRMTSMHEKTFKAKISQMWKKEREKGRGRGRGEKREREKERERENIYVSKRECVPIRIQFVILILFA
jgi:hypothetical protein